MDVNQAINATPMQNVVPHQYSASMPMLMPPTSIHNFKHRRPRRKRDRRKTYRGRKLGSKHKKYRDDSDSSSSSEDDSESEATSSDSQYSYTSSSSDDESYSSESTYLSTVYSSSEYDSSDSYSSSDYSSYDSSSEESYSSRDDDEFSDEEERRLRWLTEQPLPLPPPPRFITLPPGAPEPDPRIWRKVGYPCTQPHPQNPIDLKPTVEIEASAKKPNHEGKNKNEKESEKPKTKVKGEKKKKKEKKEKEKNKETKKDITKLPLFDDEKDELASSFSLGGFVSGLGQKLGYLRDTISGFIPDSDAKNESQFQGKELNPTSKKSKGKLASFDRSLASNFMEGLKSDKKNETCFFAVSFNILADRYVTNPREADMYSHCNPECLEWNYRLNLILSHLGEVDADIICLQEVDTDVFEESLQPLLRQRGYAGVLQTGQGGNKRKKKRNKLHDTGIDDPPGIATFFKSSLFETNWVIESFRASILGLTIKKGRHKGRTLSLINCHLEGAPWKHKERKSQLDAAIKKLNKMEYSFSLLCGDFNSSLARGSSAIHSAEQKGYKSAYAEHSMQDVTCLISPDKVKTKKSQSAEAMVDNILHDSSLDLLGVMNIMDTGWNRKKVIKTGLPSMTWPSDHLSVGAVFSLSNPSSTSGNKTQANAPARNIGSELTALREQLKQTLTETELRKWESFEQAEDAQKKGNKRFSPRFIEAVKTRSREKQEFLSNLSEEKQKLLDAYKILKKKMEKKKKKLK